MSQTWHHCWEAGRSGLFPASIEPRGQRDTALWCCCVGGCTWPDGFGSYPSPPQGKEVSLCPLVLLQEQNPLFMQASCVCVQEPSRLCLFSIENQIMSRRLLKCHAAKQCLGTVICVLPLYIVMLLSVSFAEEPRINARVTMMFQLPQHQKEDVCLHIRKTLSSFPVNLASLEDFLPKLKAWGKTDGRGEVLPPKTLGAVLQVLKEIIPPALYYRGKVLWCRSWHMQMRNNN